MYFPNSKVVAWFCVGHLHAHCAEHTRVKMFATDNRGYGHKKFWTEKATDPVRRGSCIPTLREHTCSKTGVRGWYFPHLRPTFDIFEQFESHFQVLRVTFYVLPQLLSDLVKKFVVELNIDSFWGLPRPGSIPVPILYLHNIWIKYLNFYHVLRPCRT